MKKKRLLILGAGISGLSLAYFLREFFEITVIERSGRPGGVIASTSADYFFERGPRTFRAAKCADLLQLVHELDLDSEIITAHGSKRYLWLDGKLQPISFWRPASLAALATEWRVAPAPTDESVWDFACRRFNATVARHFFDPLVTGIYGGDSRNVSVQSCFPTFKQWERQYGSITKGFFHSPRVRGPELFTFQNGVERVVKALVKKSGATFLWNETVEKMNPFPDRVEVTTNRQTFTADIVCCALSLSRAAKLLALPEILQIDATVVNLGYPTQVVSQRGFGYIVSSQENEEVLGVVFDSHTFPQQNRSTQETRLTVMIRGLSKEAEKLSLQALQKHLGVREKPESVTITQIPGAFPQMAVGHQEKMQAFEKTLHPRLRLTGNYLYGVGVSDCVARAKSVAESCVKAFAS